MIHFVGAGCGAADLITVRGLKYLEKADVVIYAGSLVNPELLKYTKEGCRIFNSVEMVLEEIMDEMISADKKGLDVVRLHTGEPSLYGAVKEQMEELDKAGIPYDSCPGVSACFGAASSLNLEYTLPEVSQTLIITRMEGRTSVPEKEKIKNLASHNASMAVYLSSGLLDKLSEALIEGGYAPDTPAAIVYKATWPDEKICPCTVSTLSETGKKNDIKKTAVILVGNVLDTSNIVRSRLYSSVFSTEFRKAKK